MNLITVHISINGYFYEATFPTSEAKMIGEWITMISEKILKNAKSVPMIKLTLWNNGN